MLRVLTGVLLTASLVWGQPGPSAVQERDLIRRRPSVVKDAASGETKVPQGYAVVIGVGGYEDANIRPLRFSERDAEEVYRVLISQDGGFEARNVHKLIGRDATLANIRRELEEWLPSVAKAGDRVIIYFAGHGFIDSGKGYLAPYDTTLRKLQSSAYPMAALETVMGSSIKARWKALFTDACHSGAMQPITKETSDEAVNQSLASLGASISLFSFAASTSREQSFEDPNLEGGRGLFSYYLVKGLDGQADDDRDGLVTAAELVHYVTRTVYEHARRYNVTQSPTPGRGEFDPGMVLTYNPARVKAGGPELASKDGQLVITVNMDDVELFVNGKSVGVAQKSTPFRVPGLQAGDYEVKGVRRGYFPDGPKTVRVAPGETKSVPITITAARTKKQAAVDVFERGFESYQRKGNAQGYKTAAADFQKALKEDPHYSDAALYAGRAFQMLGDWESARRFFEQALQIDPDYAEARVGFAAMLLDAGDTEEAIRQLQRVLSRDAKNGLAYSTLSHAFRLVGDFGQAAQAARRATALPPQDANSYLWLGDSLRLQNQVVLAKEAYQHALQLSNLDATAGEKVRYYLFGSMIGQLGTKRAASRRDVYRDQRNLAFLGICSCEMELGRRMAAVDYCRAALKYDPSDPYSHYLLGKAYIEEFDEAKIKDKQMLLAAQTHYQKMLSINSDLEESDIAKQHLKEIQRVLALMK